MTNQGEATIRNNKIVKIAEILVGIMGIAMVAYFIIFKEKAEFNSDYTDTLLWADAALRGNGIYNKDFIYAYLLPFSGNLLMIPVVALFGVTYKAHVLGMLVFCIVFFISVYIVLKSFNYSKAFSFSISGVFIALLCASQVTRMIFYGHVIHYSLGLLFSYIALALVVKMDYSSKSVKDYIRSNAILLLTLFFWYFLCMSNGFSIVMFFLIPTMGCVLVERMVDSRSKLSSLENIYSYITASSMLGGGFLGLIAYKILDKIVNKSYEDYFFQLIESDDWIWEPIDLLRGFITLSTEKLMDSIDILSGQGIKIIILIVFSMFIIILPIVALIFYKRYKEKYMRLLVLYHWILVAVTLFIYNISTLGGTRWRLCGIYGSSILVSIVFIVWMVDNRGENVLYVRMAVPCALMFAISLVVIAIGVVKLPSGDSNRYSRLASVLKQENLNYGYADFWSASVTTVLSDSEVAVRPITIDDEGNVKVRYYQTYMDWYEDQEGVEKYFIFASNEEYSNLMNYFSDEIANIIWFDADGYILVFDHNIFEM